MIPELVAFMVHSSDHSELRTIANEIISYVRKSDVIDHFPDTLTQEGWTLAISILALRKAHRAMGMAEQ